MMSVTFGLRDNDERQDMQFTRHPNNPVFSANNQNPVVSPVPVAPTIYKPFIIRACDHISSPIDDYYMYYSTDHDSGVGGIYLATAPTVYGPWSSHGMLFVDTTSGSQTETAAVMWSEDEQLYFMYYQQATVTGANGNQTTMYAQSTDGVNWVRQGIAVDLLYPNQFPGDGHTGYFRPFRIGKQWYGYHLLGGTDFPQFGMSTSYNGRDWMIDPRPLSYGSDKFTDGRRIEWNNSNVIWRNGRYYLITMFSNFTSGGATKDARLGYAPLSNDFRNIIGKPTYILYPTIGSNESTNYRDIHIRVEDDTVIAYYQCDDNFNIATEVFYDSIGNS